MPVFRLIFPRAVSTARMKVGASADGTGGSAQGRPPHQDDAAWPDPIDFLGDSDLTGAPKLKPEHLPEALVGFVFDTATRMGVDPAAVALNAVVACASVCHDAWAIQPKIRDDSWVENPRLWGAIVGDPSIMKTPVLKVCTRPIDLLDAEARDSHAKAMRDWKAAVATAKLDKVPPESWPPKPKCDRYLVEGTTTEALSEVLRDDDEANFRAPTTKVLVRQDEMSGWLGDMDRYRAGGKGGGDRAAYLTLYNGGRYMIDRIGRGSFAIPNWSGCVLGGIQPEPIQRIAKDAADDGLLQRFVYCVPEGQADGEDRQRDRAAADRYEALFPALVTLHPPRAFAGASPRAVVLHADAHQHRIAINALAKAQASWPDASNRLKSALGKWPATFARLALTFHLVDLGDALARGIQGPVPVVLSEITARRAAAYMRDILLPHLLRAETLLFLTPQTGHARWIAGYLLANESARDIGRVAMRDVTRAYKPLRAPERRRELVEVMTQLEVMGWLKAEPHENPARGTTNWAVNPKLYVVLAKAADVERARRRRAQEEMTETITASVRIIPRITPRVNPSTFSTPTSRTRSRTDMAMVLALTSRMVNITAAQTTSRNALMFPRKETKLSENALSLSVFVWVGELRNSSSTAFSIRGTSPTVFARIRKIPALPRRRSGMDCSRYSRLKYRMSVFCSESKIPRTISSSDPG